MSEPSAEVRHPLRFRLLRVWNLFVYRHVPKHTDRDMARMVHVATEAAKHERA